MKIARLSAALPFGMLLMSPPLVAQEKYETAIAQVAESINTSLGLTPTATVLVSSFNRMDGQGCDLDDMITMDFEAALLAKPHSYKLLDRANLDAIAEEHKLAMKGMMDDEQRMKEAGRLLKADAIVFGTYRLAGNTLLIRVKAVDIQTSEQLAIVPSNCEPSTLLKTFCDAKPGATQVPKKAVEVPAQQQPVAQPCSTNTGSYCFKSANHQNIKVSLRTQTPASNGVQLSNGDQLVVRSGKEECYFDKPAGVYNFTVESSDQTGANRNRNAASGSIRIEPCKTGTYTYP